MNRLAATSAPLLHHCDSYVVHVRVRAVGHHTSLRVTPVYLHDEVRIRAFDSVRTVISPRDAGLSTATRGACTDYTDASNKSSQQPYCSHSIPRSQSYRRHASGSLASLRKCSVEPRASQSPEPSLSGVEPRKHCDPPPADLPTAGAFGHSGRPRTPGMSVDARGGSRTPGRACRSTASATASSGARPGASATDARRRSAAPPPARVRRPARGVHPVDAGCPLVRQLGER